MQIAMVTRYGMSEELGHVALEKDQRSFLSPSSLLAGPRDRNFSDHTASAIDREVRLIVDQCPLFPRMKASAGVAATSHSCQKQPPPGKNMASRSQLHTSQRTTQMWRYCVMGIVRSMFSTIVKPRADASAFNFALARPVVQTSNFVLRPRLANSLAA